MAVFALRIPVRRNGILAKLGRTISPPPCRIQRTATRCGRFDQSHNYFNHCIAVKRQTSAIQNSGTVAVDRQHVWDFSTFLRFFSYPQMAGYISDLDQFSDHSQVAPCVLSTKESERLPVESNLKRHSSRGFVFEFPRISTGLELHTHVAPLNSGVYGLQYPI